MSSCVFRKYGEAMKIQKPTISRPTKLFIAAAAVTGLAGTIWFGVQFWNASGGFRLNLGDAGPLTDFAEGRLRQPANLVSLDSLKLG